MKDSIRGKIIHLEGPDGCGKTTQAALLRTFLEGLGHEVAMGRQPGTTPIGEAMRRLLFEGALETDPVTRRLLFAASHCSLEREVYARRKRDVVWLIDRYVPVSNFVFGHYGDGVDPAFIHALNGPPDTRRFPDLVVVLEVSENTMLERIRARQNAAGETNFYDLQDLDFKARIRRGYAEILQWIPPEERPLIRCIEAEGSIEKVQRELRALLSAEFRLEGG